MKLNVDVLRYLSKDDFRVLTAVEMGMRNHEIVPVPLIDRIAALKHGGTHKVLRNLLLHKLVHHDSSKYDGYRLTYMGYDFLAIKSLVNRGVFCSVGRKIGTGKESDIFEVATEDGTVLAMKLHRLGRVSFRAVKAKRDYLKHRTSYSWLYLSRLAALKEFAFMKALEDHGFPVPNSVDCNRHCVVMSLVDGYQLEQVKEIQNPEVVFETIIGLVVRLAEHGLIHCDFNEFNIMIGDDEKITMIDFPQMVSVSHHNAQTYFDRDIECIYKFFNKRFNVSLEENSDEQDNSDVEGSDGVVKPRFADIKKDSGFLDKEVAASGFTRKDQADIEQLMEGDEEEDSDMEENEEEEGSDTEANEEEGLEGDEENIEDLGSLSLSKDEDNEHLKPCSTSTEERETENETNQGETETNSDEDKDENDPELMKRLGRQRRQVINAARGGKKVVTSRNSYKDKGKGGKSSHNSKIQKGNW